MAIERGTPFGEPVIASSAWVHATAIVIGAGSNVQDGAVIHCDPGQPCIIGERVTIGHRTYLALKERYRSLTRE